MYRVNLYRLAESPETEDILLYEQQSGSLEDLRSYLEYQIPQFRRLFDPEVYEYQVDGVYRVVITPPAPAPKAEPKPEPVDVPDVKEMSAEATIAFASVSEDIELLEKMLDGETVGKKRSTVIAALTDRIEELSESA